MARLEEIPQVTCILSKQAGTFMFHLHNIRPFHHRRFKGTSLLAVVLLCSIAGLAQQVGLHSQVPLGSLHIDDPKLAEAYRYFFLSEEGRSGSVDSVPVDIRQRGMGSADLVMRLFDENAEHAVRDCILYWIDEFPNLPVDAFREKVRKLIRQDAGSLSRKDCVYFAEFLANHGTAADIPLLEKMVAIDPNGEIGLFVGKYLKKLNERLLQKASNGRIPEAEIKAPTNSDGAK